MTKSVVIVLLFCAGLGVMGKKRKEREEKRREGKGVREGEEKS